MAFNKFMHVYTGWLPVSKTFKNKLVLLGRMTNKQVPKHIGIILDGNRRFAKKLMMKPWMGHEWGAKKVSKILDWCREADIKEITFYAFSVQNFDRPKLEFNFLMDLFRKEYKNLLTDERVDKYGLRFNFIGRIHMFPKDIQDMMHDIMDRTKKHDKIIVNFAMAYGGQEEVIDAVVKLAKDMRKGDVNIDDINKEMFSKYLYTSSEPDLIIRTGGEHRTSNFLIWQSHYSEWIFLEKTWPEFEKKDFIECLANYAERERRFGK